MKSIMAIIIKRLFLSILLAVSALSAVALPSEFYAPSSRLASGSWAKIEISESGMQLIPNSVLKSLGFNDPDKVNVYGAGGRILSERLDKNMFDDLPILPSVVTSEGILFFGHANVTWASSANNPTHKPNPYSENAYYFISDCEAERPIPAETTLTLNPALEPVTVFNERLLHEQDLLAPYDSGRVILGEDFKTKSKQTFNFRLPDAAGVPTVRVCFGAKVSNGKSTVGIQLNNSQRSTHEIAGVSSSETFLVRQTFTNSTLLTEPVENLDVIIDYSNTGLATTAALDYIEVYYQRHLRMTGNDLYFYIQGTRSQTIAVEGCSSDTQIWDVTDPLNPKKVNHTLEGSRALFPKAAGFQEYVAFNPGKVSNSAVAAGKVENQDIHAMEIPDMLIIAPEAYRASAQKIADLHQQNDGLKSVVLTPELIYNEFSSGKPDVTAFRKLLKMWYDRANEEGVPYTRYCLLMGRASYDQKLCTAAGKRDPYPRIPIWHSETGFSETTSYSTDDYIGMLDDNAADLNMGTARIRTAIGRMPVKSAAEAEAAFVKLENYLTSPNLGAWRNSVMIIADDQDNGTHLDQAEKVYNNMIAQKKGKDYRYEKLYLDSYKLSYSGVGAVYPEAKAKMLEKWNEGLLWLNYIGHANPKSWTHENLFTWEDINSMANPNLPFLYAATCEFMRWEADDVSGGELLWLNPSGGVIGLICPSRTVYISLNGNLNVSTANYVFGSDSSDGTFRAGDIMVKGKNGLISDTNRLRYGFCGDPALPLPIPSLDLAVSSINGTPVSSGDDFPTFGARERLEIEGEVKDAEGNLAADFDGILNLSIYDAEKVITTYGNGSNGTVSNYNDRKTRLYQGRVKVSGGKWKAEAFLPSEIQNNFSPAQISMYAVSDKGREANGSFEQFYIYGYAQDAPEDSAGPEITAFHLNTPAFADGGSVNPSPTLFAKFSDGSGINVSEGGIGHNITLSLDEKQYFSDVTRYYLPDEEDPCSGSVTYPLENLSPGEHTLTLIVWDNANNSTSATLRFNVAANWMPQITTLYADASPAVSSVNFILATDGAKGNMSCNLEVLDLNGRTIWTSQDYRITERSTQVRIPWNLSADNGARVPRGIYLYRATLNGDDGFTRTKTKKIAVSPQ